jgi:hypothetical protein
VVTKMAFMAFSCRSLISTIKSTDYTPGHSRASM